MPHVITAATVAAEAATSPVKATNENTTAAMLDGENLRTTTWRGAGGATVTGTAAVAGDCPA